MIIEQIKQKYALDSRNTGTFKNHPEEMRKLLRKMDGGQYVSDPLQLKANAKDSFKIALPGYDKYLANALRKYKKYIEIHTKGANATPETKKFDIKKRVIDLVNQNL